MLAAWLGGVRAEGAQGSLEVEQHQTREGRGIPLCAPSPEELCPCPCVSSRPRGAGGIRGSGQGLILETKSRSREVGGTGQGTEEYGEDEARARKAQNRSEFLFRQNKV